MKPKLSPFPPLLTLFSLVACVAASGDSHDIEETLDLRAATLDSPDALPAEVLEAIHALLPENEDVTGNEELFKDYDPNPAVVHADTDVWVTFVQEGAGFENALGFFTYPTGQPPASLTLEELEDGLVFANASNLQSGGALENGTRMYLGRFQPGVQIGFYLVQDGHCGEPGVGSCSAQEVDFSKTIFTTLDAMNPEFASDPDAARHVVLADLLDDPASDARLLAFEDLGRLGAADNDFNDVVFRVSATPALACDDCPIVTGAADFLVGRGANAGGMLAECRYDVETADYTCAKVQTSCEGPACTPSGLWQPQVAMTGDVDGDGTYEYVQYNAAWSSIPTVFRQPDANYVANNLSASCTECPYNPGRSNGVFAATHAAMGDFDGDGRADVAQFRGGSWASIPTCRFDPVGFDWDCGNYPAACTPGGANCQGRNLYPASILLAADTNAQSPGDELVQYHPSWRSLPTCEFIDSGSFGTWHCDNIPTTCDPMTSTSCGAQGSGSWATPLAAAGDFDGDGHDEIAQFGPSNQSIPVCFYDEDVNIYRCDNTPAACIAGGDCSVSNGNSGIQPGTERVIATDVNEDGCDDIVMQNDGWGFYGTCLSPCVSSTTWLAGDATWACDQSGALCSGDCGNYGSGVWPHSGIFSAETT